MRRRLCSHSFNSTGDVRRDEGYSIIEFLVAMVLSSIVGLMIISITIANRTTYSHDIGRTKANQDLRTALNIIGTEIRQAGEQFPASFPAILITDGGSSPDTLTVRRNLLSSVLVGCDTFNAGTTYSQSNLVKTSPVTPVCTYPNQQTAYTAWYNYAHPLNAVQPIYIFNQTTKNGEFLSLSTTIGGSNSSNIFINYAGKAMQYAYTAEYTSIYMIEEWKFVVNNGVLQIIQNNNTTTPQNITDGITGFSVSALMQDGTTKTALAQSDSWSLVASIQVSLTGTEYIGGKKYVSRTVSSSFFPRNILSN